MSEELEFLTRLRDDCFMKAKLLRTELRRHSAAEEAKAQQCDDCAYDLDKRINELHSKVAAPPDRRA